jgi:biotin transport system substrate-specific component
MTGLIAVGAYISIPLPASPVPVVLQNFFVLLAGVSLGPLWGSLSVLVYLGIGAIGLPVFAGGAGGLAVFAGPTGGYLVGFLPAALLAGLISHFAEPKLWKDALAAATGALAIYALGLPWLKVATGLDWPGTLAAGLLPFVVGDVLKVIAAVGVGTGLRRLFDRFEGPG